MENPELSQTLSLQLGVGLNVTVLASSSARNSHLCDFGRSVSFIIDNNI